MKIFVIHASAGAGHTKVAEAIFNHLKSAYPEEKVFLVDALDVSAKFLQRTYKIGYSFMVRRALFLWAVSFWITDFFLLRPFTRSIAIVVNMVNTLALSRLLIKEAPDFIISTHFLATDVAANLKVIGKLKSKIINVITDFGVHSFWIAKGVDRYIVASGFTKEQLVLRGVPENKISDFGIPTSDKFMRNYDKEGILKGLGLQDKFTVLVMSGSFGIGPIEKIVRLLQGQLQMIVVCGRNRSLCRKLEKLRLSGVKVFGLVKSVADLMAASDLVITKPGGLSIAEILNMELVPVFISPIPGQEAANIEVLKSYGIGFYPARIDEVKEIVLWLAKNPGELEPIKNNILRIKKPDALKEITSVIR